MTSPLGTMLQGNLSLGSGFEPDICMDGDDLSELLCEWFTLNRSKIEALDITSTDEIPVRLTLEVMA